MKTNDVVLVGVGGQGVILAMRILGDAAIGAKLDVKSSEIHGMAQRGGSVVTHVRMGKIVYAPQVAEASADVILSFEPAEVLRVLHFACRETRIVMNTSPVVPTTVSIGTSHYPSLEEVRKECKKFSDHIVEVDALKLASDAGSSVALNIVLLGALAATGILPVKPDALKASIRKLISSRYRNVNLAAFDNGYRAASFK